MLLPLLFKARYLACTERLFKELRDGRLIVRFQQNLTVAQPHDVLNNAVDSESFGIDPLLLHHVPENDSGLGILNKKDLYPMLADVALGLGKFT